jgi:cell division protein FtsB
MAGLISAVLVASPALAFADFNDTAQRAQAQANSLTTEQLDNLNTRVVNDSYVTARIVGFDPAELAQLKADVAALKQENARLRSQGSVAAAVRPRD